MKTALALFLYASSLEVCADAAVITLAGPTSGSLSTGPCTDSISLTGPFFSLSNLDQGGQDAVNDGTPVGSEVDFFAIFLGQYAAGNPFYPQINGYVQTSSGQPPALFTGSVQAAARGTCRPAEQTCCPGYFDRNVHGLYDGVC